MKATKFKSTELGPIPVDWEVKQFDDTFEHISSKPFQLQSSKYQEGGRFQVVDQGQMEIVGYTDDAKKLFRVPRGGVIIFGDHTRIIKFRESDFVVGADGTQLLVGKKDYTRFLFYALQQLDIPNVGYARHFKYIKEGRYVIPSNISEQRRIAGALSDVDELIFALGKLIEKKRNIKTGAMQELLTGKTRLPGFKGKWVEKRLGECGTWLGGGTPSTDIPHYWQGSVPWISSSDIEEGNIWNVSKTRFVSNDGIVNSAACICPRGTIHIVTRVGIGKVAIATEPVCTSQDYANLVSAQCDNKFLAFLISVVMLSKKEETQGTSIKGITLEDLKKIVLSVPPTLAEQKAIAAVLSDMDAEIAALEADRAKYERIKSGMMQELLTGKTRLKGE